MIDFSTKNIIDIFLGSKTIQEGYYGTALVYQKTQPEPEPYITFKALASSTIGLAKKSSNQTLYYSTNGNTWSIMTTSTTLNISSGNKVYIRGNLYGDNTNTDYTKFTITGNVKVSGDINALWNYSNLTASLKKYCGFSLFSGCTGLTDASRLKLSATILSDRCYYNMFNGCTALNAAPVIKSTTLASYCCSGMFLGCTSLTIAPNLNATTLAEHCYEAMFQNCSSLTTAPAILPATTLADSCYNLMFSWCSRLIAAPELPAKTLVNNCYKQMFYSCARINYIKCLATDISATDCTRFWCGNFLLTTIGTFVKDASMTSWTIGESGIPSNWTIQNA